MPTTCAVAVITPSKKILLVHATGAGYYGGWSLPKGIKDENETEKQAAIRECHEEAGLDISSRASELVDLGSFPYGKERQYHLFMLKYGAEVDVKKLKCSATFSDHGDLIVECDKFQMASIQGCQLLLGKKQSSIIMSMKEKLFQA